ncbi:MAG: TonB-dependent receptor [Cyclobacteriaceae bacterium]
MLPISRVVRIGIVSIYILFSLENEATGQQLLDIEVTDVKVTDVIDYLREHGNIDFIYNDELLARAGQVTLNLKGVSIDQILEEALRNSGLTFIHLNETIVIKSAVVAVEGPKQSVRGTVLDIDSKEPLPFATVQIMDSIKWKGTTTDINGNFNIQGVPIGRYSIHVRFVGYEDAVINEVLVGSAKQVVLNIEMEESIQSLDEFVLIASDREPLNEMSTVSARSFNVEESQRYAASISDPARMAQVFAGVGITDDASNEISIRGNSPNWLQWRLEGVEIPSPNHFAEEGYSAGAVNILSVNMLGSSDFLTGAFAAEYGNALSGVFDIHLRRGNNKRKEYTFQVGLLGFDLSTEGPFKEDYDGSYIVNYRYSSLALLNQVGIQISENALPRYQDLSFKAFIPTKKMGRITVWGIGGFSSVDEGFVADSSVNEPLDAGYEDNTQAGMYAVGITHFKLLKNQSYVRSVWTKSLGFSSEQTKKANASGWFYDDFFDRSSNDAVRLNSYYHRKLKPNASLRVGTTLSHLRYDYRARQKSREEDPWNEFLRSEGRFVMYQFYSQIKTRLSKRILINSGLHISGFTLNPTISIEPRLGIQMGLTKRSKMSFAYGLHSRHENLPVYFLETTSSGGQTFLPNGQLKLTKSHHAVAGFEQKLKSNVHVKIEAYYQFVPNLPVPNNPDKYWSPIFGGMSPMDTLVNQGKQRNYGIELTFQKYFSDGYYYMVTGSLFDSKFQQISSDWLSTRYNLGRILNLVGGKEFEFGGNKRLGLNTKLVWTGGKRLLPINLDRTLVNNEVVIDWHQIYDQQATDYLRWDIGVRQSFFGKRFEHSISLDIQNVTNKRNVWALNYNPYSKELENYPMAGLIPIFNYRLAF